MTDARRIAWPVVGRGVVAGAPNLAAALVLQLLVLAASDDPPVAWAFVLLGLLFVGFFRAGAKAAMTAPGRWLTHAAVAGLALFGAWLPLRIVIALVGDSDRPFGGIVGGAFAAVLVSLLGGVAAARAGRVAGAVRRDQREGSGEPDARE